VEAARGVVEDRARKFEADSAGLTAQQPGT
jgi:hypothetical protein